MPHTLLVPASTRSRLEEYVASLREGKLHAGERLAEKLADKDLATLTDSVVLDALLNTKPPQIFAECEVAGDGSDWNLVGLGILGDISIAVPVTIFDDGHHTAPVPHAEPFKGNLIFTPGALLRNGRGQPPADWAEVTLADGALDPEGYYGLYERRLLPVFHHVNATAFSQGKEALISIPGLGCGQFAGPFAGQLGAGLQAVLERFLTKHGASFPHIKAVYYDPFRECSNARQALLSILPIEDMGIPDAKETMEAILKHIRESSSIAPAVYIHCWGGIGRTGTVVGCWLRESGYDSASALDRVQHLYSSNMPKVRFHPESPQTLAQKNYVCSWQPLGEQHKLSTGRNPELL